jgi:hypothetical protein
MKNSNQPSTQTNAKIFQFKIKLYKIDPPIWRRVQIFSDSTFAEFSDVILRAMGWDDSHMHGFAIKNIYTNIKDRIVQKLDGADHYDEEKDEETVTLDEYFSRQNKKAKYIYDYGDDWLHDIALEKIMDEDTNQIYPRCIAGERACPPEDCGGVWGYEDILNALSDPTNPENEGRVEWYGYFKPEDFDYRDVKFS